MIPLSLTFVYEVRQVKAEEEDDEETAATERQQRQRRNGYGTDT